MRCSVLQCVAVCYSRLMGLTFQTVELLVYRPRAARIFENKSKPMRIIIIVYESMIRRDNTTRGWVKGFRKMSVREKSCVIVVACPPAEGVPLVAADSVVACLAAAKWDLST